MKKILFLLAGFLLPAGAHAHVKWFVETEEVIEQEVFHFSIQDPFVLAWSLFVLAIIVLSYYFETVLPEPSSYFQKTVKKWGPKVLWVTKAATGAWLIILSWQGHVLAEPFFIDGAFQQSLQVLQVVTGLLLISGFLQRVGGILLALIFFGSMVAYGWSMIEHIFVLGLALNFLFAPQKKKDFFSGYSDWSLPLLRFFTGISLIALGLSEKLLHPELGLEFLRQHNWNFMQLIGIDWFNNVLFVLSAGMTEMLFGIILVIGTVTRINTIALAVVFLTTAIVLGPNELIGHLPLFAIALVLILYGSGKKLKVTNLLPSPVKKKA